VFRDDLVKSPEFGSIPSIVFGNKQVLAIMETNFITGGVLAKTALGNYIDEFIKEKDVPCIACFRQSIFEKPALVEFAPLNKSMDIRQFCDKLLTME